MRNPEATPPTKSGGIFADIPEFPALVITIVFSSTLFFITSLFVPRDFLMYFKFSKFIPSFVILFTKI